MATLAQLLLGLAGPLALRVILSLGIGVLTFTGVTESLRALITSSQSNWASVASDVLALAGVAGIPACLGLITGAMSARVGAWAAASAVRWIVR